MTNIDKENLNIINDRYVEAGRFDDHTMHIALHYKMLELPENRNNKELVSRLAKHIKEHTILLQSLIAE